MNEAVLIIPARYASTRLPGKPLLSIAGKPMIQHVYERAAESSFTHVYIATDDARIQKVCESFGAKVLMTSDKHESGSDRLAEVVELLELDNETIVVNLQGDEPLTPVVNLQQVAENLAANPQASIATLSTPIDNANDFNDANIVKVVADQQGRALYFSRAPVPFPRDTASGNHTGSNNNKENDENKPFLSHLAQRHIGIYAYRAGYLKRFANYEPCALELEEKLEQLRAMYHGEMIHVEEAREIPGHGVDTEEDLIRVEKLLSATI